MSRDSAFGRLISAWGTGAKPSLAELARDGLRALTPQALRRSELNDVLWVTLDRQQDVPLRDVVASIARAPVNYIVRPFTPADAHVMAEALRRLRPRLLVADVEWCDHVGPAALRDLHRHAPATDWILRWPEASPRWLEAIVACGARATVERGDDEQALARALDAVFKGDLWLSRRVIGWLYATIVEPHAAASTYPASAQPTSNLNSDLTPRESEVAELMRRGLTNIEIAQRLGVSVNTVKKHLASSYEKMGVRSRRQVR